MSDDESDLEDAVEIVVRWLDARGHHDLAGAVAVATDPDSEERKAAAAIAVRQLLTWHRA